MRTQPRKMSLTACISRCPTTTRCPEFSNSLAPTNSSSTDGPACFACRNSGSTSSSPSSPSSSSIHARVPTLPTRAWAETACDRHDSARALIRPILDGSAAALLPPSVNRRPAAGGLDCGHRRRPLRGPPRAADRTGRRRTPRRPPPVRPGRAGRLRTARAPPRQLRRSPTTSPTAPSTPDRDRQSDLHPARCRQPPERRAHRPRARPAQRRALTTEVHAVGAPPVRTPTA